MTDERKAGAELDAEISRVVFQRKVRINDWGHPQWWRTAGKFEGWDSVPCYSTDIARAWQVIERLREIGLEVIIGTERDGEQDGWEVEITVNEALYQQGYRGVYRWDRSAAEAICHAALYALAAVSKEDA